MATRKSNFFRYFPVSERDRKWGLYLLTVGESRVPAGAPYPPAGHPQGYAFDWAHGRVFHEYQVVYISGGRGWFESDGVRKTRVESGDVILLFPGVWHRYTPDPQTGWTEHWIGFEGPTAQLLMKEGFFSPQKPTFRVGREDELLEKYAAVMEAVKTNVPALQQVMAGWVMGILGHLVSSQHAGDSNEAGVADAIKEAIGLMDANVEQTVDLESLAEQLNVGYSWFRRAFARHTGLSPHQYLLQLRLAKSRRLLTETTLCVKEVSVRSGFADEHYFCRLFRDRTGLTPNQWRARSRRSGGADEALDDG